jgi:AcrR family transcriptional regulator
MPTSVRPLKQARSENAAITHQQRGVRTQTLAGVKRQYLLDAARSAFFELGMEKTSIREIAQRAGYTPGAIYKYFASKEEIYGALLGESLERLYNHVHDAIRQNPHGSAARLRTAALAFFDFYSANPHDLDLGFYLFQGMKPRGLTPALNEQLNAQLLASLSPVRVELEGLGMPSEIALQEVTSLFAHAVGLLVMSHTGRIRMFKQASQDLFDIYLDQLEVRAKTSVRRPGRDL